MPRARLAHAEVEPAGPAAVSGGHHGRAAGALAAAVAVSVIAPGLALAAQEQSGAQVPAAGGLFESMPGLDNVSLVYDRLSIDGNVWRLSGDVDLRDTQRGVRLLADELSFDIDTQEFEASGSVSFEQSDMLINGTDMRGDLDDATLEMSEVVGIGPGPVYVRARRLEQLEPGKFRIEGGTVTPCNQTNAIWAFRASSMIFEPGDHVSMSWPTVRIKGVPVFGLPYMYWPLQDQARQTGFLLPALGISNLKGFMFSETFFAVLSRSADVSLTYERFSKAGNAYGAEFRHAFGEHSRGFVNVYHLAGREVTEEELDAGERSFASGWSVNGGHYQNLPNGFTLRARASFITSTDFARSIRDDIDRLFQRQSVASADITKAWGSSTLTLVADHTENFNSNTFSTIGRRQPQLKYSLRSTRVGGPFYVALQSSVSRLQRFAVDDRTDSREGGTYTRFDAFPEISVPITKIPWLTFNPFFRWRATRYSHSETQSFDFQSESIFRNFYETGLEMVGPSAFRIFETPGSGYSPRLKHVVQPRVIYRRVRQVEVDQPGRVIRFDEIDSQVTDRQAVTTEVTTRLFAQRYPDARAEERQVWQAAEITIGRDFNLDPGPEQLEAAGAPRIRLPYFVRTRVTPSQRVYIDGAARFTPSLTLANYQLSAQINAAPIGGRLTWLRGVFDVLDPMDLTQVLVATNSNSLRADLTANLFGDHLSVRGGTTVDLFGNNVQQYGGSVQWNLQCCGIGVNMQRINLTDREETRFSFILNLAQVGQLGFGTDQR